MSRATLSLVALAGLTIGCGSGIKDIVVQPAPSTLQALQQGIQAAQGR